MSAPSNRIAMNTFSKRSTDYCLVIEDSGIALHYGWLTFLGTDLKAVRKKSLFYVVSHD